MTEVKILIAGYAKKSTNGWRASSTTVLIKDKQKNIIVDPGANRKLLLNKLEKEGLRPKDINLVFLTHYHPDHWLAIDLFPGIKVLDGDIVYQNDQEIGYQKKIPGTDILVIFTPGHAHEHAVLMASTKIGRVVVAGDLWWWSEKEKQITNRQILVNKKDPYTKDRRVLIKSRKKILSLADYIIPGHGRVFKMEK